MLENMNIDCNNSVRGSIPGCGLGKINNDSGVLRSKIDSICSNYMVMWLGMLCVKLHVA